MNFKEWMSNTRTLYHMSPFLFDKFRGDKPFFFKQTEKEAREMMNVGNYMYTCEVDLGNLFEPNQLYDSKTEPYISNDPNRLTKLGKEVYDLISNNLSKFDLEEEDVLEAVLEAVLYANKGSYDIIENPTFLDWLKSKGYDSFIVTEYKEPSIGVFDSDRIHIIKRQKI